MEFLLIFPFWTKEYLRIYWRIDWCIAEILRASTYKCCQLNNYACFWFVIRMITSLLWKKHWQHKWFINWGIKEEALPQAGASVDINSMVIWAGLVNSLAKFQLLSAKEAKGHEMINCYWLMQLLLVIAELAKHSPIIIQNSSNPSSRKNLDLWPYDHTTDRTRCYF